MVNNQYQNNYYNYNTHSWQQQYNQYQQQRGNVTNIEAQGNQLLWHDKQDFITTAKAFYIFATLSILMIIAVYIYTNRLRFLVATVLLDGGYFFYLMTIIFFIAMIIKNHTSHKDKLSVQAYLQNIQAKNQNNQAQQNYNY